MTASIHSGLCAAFFFSILLVLYYTPNLMHRFGIHFQFIMYSILLPISLISLAFCTLASSFPALVIFFFTCRLIYGAGSGFGNIAFFYSVLALPDIYQDKKTALISCHFIGYSICNMVAPEVAILVNEVVGFDWTVTIIGIFVLPLCLLSWVLFKGFFPA